VRYGDAISHVVDVVEGVGAVIMVLDPVENLLSYSPPA
jgi:hypothetical protein